jgi:Holliday junction resolvasome RuvABC DNA-binding subunit
VVLDLRERLGGGGAEIIAIGPLADVRDALLALGLTPVEASQVLSDIDAEGKAPDDLLREALQKVGR